MTTNYDFIAEEYEKLKTQPWRQYVEAYSYLKFIGSVTSMSILDLACGNGFYTRIFHEKEASEVYGVDLSKEMIELAIQKEQTLNQNIQYYVSNVINFRIQKTFDLITASYLLNYAKNEEDLRKMAQTIHTHLKPGAYFKTVNSNPLFISPTDLLKYHVTREDEGKENGSKVAFRFYNPDKTFIEVTNFNLSIELHEKVFEQEGFTDFKWQSISVSPDGIKNYPKDYWNTFIQSAPIICFSCRKI